MFEAFYRFRVTTIMPEKTVTETEEDTALLATTLPVQSALQQSAAEEMVKKLLSSAQGEFLFQHLGISKEELPHSQGTSQDVITYAFKISRQVGGKYITVGDVIVAYLLFEEAQTKLLFNKGIKEDEVLSVLRWVRMQYAQEEKEKRVRVHFWGSGVGDMLMSGWTLETTKYTRDFTLNSLNKEESFVGRQEEYKLLQETLVKKENNNVLLVGEVGSGKEAILAQFAQDSFQGETMPQLRNKKILEIMVGPLIAGANNRGELETRLQAIIEEISHARNVIIYLPELQDILGASSFDMNLAGALYPYLQNGKFPFIASMTPGNYKTYLENSPLKQIFTVVHLNEPAEAMVEQMVMKQVISIERKNNLIITYVALKEAIRFGDSYVEGSLLPGSAITLLSDVAATTTSQGQTLYGKTKKRLITGQDVLKKVEEKTHIALSQPDSAEKDLLLNLEERLHKRVVGQDEAIRVLAQAMRRRRSGLDSTNRPISFLFLGPTGVGKTETAKTIAEVYFGGETKMIRLDMSEYSDNTGVRRLLGAAPGEGEERGELTEKMHDAPNSLLLLDEFEKANPQILNLFLQVLDDGRLTDNRGKTVSFSHSLIIATSNAGSEFIRERVGQKGVIDQKFETELLNELQSQHIFKPELLNRFDDIVTFTPLTEEQTQAICDLILKQVAIKLAEQDITLTYDTSVTAKIAHDGYDQQFGARPMRRFIQEAIEDPLASKMLAGELVRGKKVHVTVDPANTFQFSFS